MREYVQEATVQELRDLLDQRKISSVDLTKHFLDEIDNRDHFYNAFVTVVPEVALDQARRADQMLGKGPVHPLTGIPIAVKDLILTVGQRTTAGSQMLRRFFSPYESTVARKLREQGAVLIGKTNCDEFAMGSSNEHTSFEKVCNPWNLNRVPGGSSGGSAAAVAAREVPLALGTDTGGSVRQPAAFCGIAGLKPTYGRVSRYGVVAFASSFDQVGPMAKRVQDVQHLYQAIAGHDPQDSTSSGKPVLADPPMTHLKNLRIGVPKEFLPSDLDSTIRQSFDSAVSTLEQLGANIEEVSLPHTEYAVATYYILTSAEASANLARYDGVRYTHRSSKASSIHEIYRQSRSEGFGKEVQRRILLGTYVLSSGYYEAYYRKAQRVRRLIQEDFAKTFTHVDCIATPTTPTPAFPLGSKITDPLEMYLSDVFTVPVSLAGLPALVVPCGFTHENLPLGLQLIGRPFEEPLLFQVGHAFETATRCFERRPPL